MVETPCLSDRECLEAALDADPTDQAARLALADLLYETDPEAAEAFEWEARKGRLPKQWLNFDEPGRELSERFRGHVGYHRIQFLNWPSGLPDMFYDVIMGLKKNWTRPSRREAEWEILVAAWKLLTPEARRECWAWTPPA